MATKIRLMRMGRKKRPFYRIVVADIQELEGMVLLLKSSALITHYLLKQN